MSSPERGHQRRRLGLVGLVATATVLAAWLSDLELGRLLSTDGTGGVGDLLAGLASPDLSSSFLTRIGRLAIESVLIGVLGMALALVVAIPLAVAGARSPALIDAPDRRPYATAARELVRTVARALLALFRSVPEIVWAFLFVRILGLGPGPAVLAIGLTFGGIIGKLYAELLEATDPVPGRRLRGAGAGALAILIHAQLPQVGRAWTAYALFRLECAIRSASILGVVGAGGLGTEIELSIRYFQYDKLATALLAVLVFVVALEIASHWLRRARPRWSILLMTAGALLAVAMLDIPWARLVGEHAASQTASFFAGFAHPTSSGEFLTRAAQLAVLTVAMAWCATVLAACAAVVLAPLAATTFTIGGYLEDAPRGRGPTRWLALGLLVPARITLQVTRALPELVWALIFVVWIGPGPTAGVLALTVHTVGILGRLFTDALEDTEPGPARALEAGGAGPLARYVYGVMPQAMPRMLAFTLFRFEVNIRNAAMVGFVGAGGLGNAIHTAISLFHWNDLATLLAVLLAVVLIADAAGDRVRSRLLRPR
ncbi:MAG TPA: ABC transporter permease subunit [Kofleriaceae bacterium]|nr:ABC transporter permease subunit [Kofleriaceae bacterium]